MRSFSVFHAVPARTQRKDLSLLKGWVSDPMAIGVVGFITRLFCKVYMGCNMFKSMALKRVTDQVQRLENATKKLLQSGHC